MDLHGDGGGVEYQLSLQNMPAAREDEIKHELYMQIPTISDGEHLQQSECPKWSTCKVTED